MLLRGSLGVVRSRPRAKLLGHQLRGPSQYLAAWVITRTLGEEAARGAIGYAAPVGEARETVERVMGALHAGEVALS